MSEKYMKLSAPKDAIKIPLSTVRDEVYYITVTARGEDANHRLTLSISDGVKVIRSYSYFVSAQKTEVYLPFVATGKERFAVVSTEDGVFYTTAPLIEKSPYDYTKTKTGTYLLPSDEWYSETVWASDTDALINDPTDPDGIENGRDRTLDCLAVGDYMYALCNGKVHVLRREDESFRHIGATQRLGELRQMALTSCGRGLAVTARNFGLYLFDISDPEHPVVSSHVDSLEMATGLDISGKFLYVADRTFGVDIIDISDIYHPVFISNIPTGETQDVCYSNGYAYAGVWAECKVRICDVRNVDAPREVGQINLSGRGDGVFVKDGILYAATGQFPPDEHKDRYNAGYGLGNGLEIWDVHDPRSPVRLSVLRGDGANYPGTPDLWRTYTSGRYLFFSNVYCGMYIYDISNKCSPKRLAHYQVLFKEQKNELFTERFVFPHQRGVTLEENRMPLPIVDSYVVGDRLYLCTGMYGSGNNLYEVKLPFYVGAPDTEGSCVGGEEATYTRSYYRADYNALLGSSANGYITDSQIRAAALWQDCLYLAAGTRGIVILDKNTLREIGSVPSLDITKDVKIKDGYLYTAESSAGVAVYRINAQHPTKPRLVGHKPVANVVQLELSPDARFAVAHISNVQGLIDLRDKSDPKLYYFNNKFHMVYQYQISIGCIADRYLAVYSTKGKLQLYDFGKGGSFEEPRIMLFENTGVINGLCADGERLFISSGKRVYRIHPEDLSEGTPICEQSDGVIVEGMLGTPVVAGNYLFTLKRDFGICNILMLNEARTEARLVKSLTLRANPGMVINDGERYYLPLGYAGIVSFTL